MIVDKIKALKHLTLQEQLVANYILDNPTKILNMNCATLAKASHTSASTIVRLCQKMELKGYGEFKLCYASQYPELLKQLEQAKEVPYQKESSIDDIIETMPLLYSKAIDYTKSLLDRNTLIRITNRLKQAERIEIYGDGMNYELAQIAVYKFEEIGVNAYAYTSTNWTHVKLLEKNKVDTVAIILSHTGKNPGIVESAARLKDCHIYIIGILGDKSSKLNLLCDASIDIMTTRNTLELSNVMFSLSTLYVFDVLVASIMLHHYDRLKEAIEELKGVRERWQED